MIPETTYFLKNHEIFKGNIKTRFFSSIAEDYDLLSEFAANITVGLE